MGVKKPYPKYTDFPIEETCYGIGAPFVGIGVYTIDMKFSWPDIECTTFKEYQKWAKHLNDSGYDIPKEYVIHFLPNKKD